MATPDIFAVTKSTEAVNRENAETGADFDQEKEKSQKRQGITAKVKEAADPHN